MAMMIPGEPAAAAAAECCRCRTGGYHGCHNYAIAVTSAVAAEVDEAGLLVADEKEAILVLLLLEEEAAIAAAAASSALTPVVVGAGPTSTALGT